MSKTSREFIKLFGPLALGVILVSTWFLHARNQNHAELVGERQRTLVALGSRIMTRDLTEHAFDAQFLARLVARRLKNESDNNLRGLEDAFTDFARSRPFYFILRYIDETGFERIRVDSSFAGPVITPPDTLQDKSNRYYFKESMQAGKNDVYVSNFDLNIEHGRIELPLRPTLRFGCPVIDKTGRKRGVVVLNFEGKALLGQIKRQADADKSIIMLCNGDGYWMLGPTPDDEWGHLLENAQDASMPARHTAAWNIISGLDKSQFQNADGLFTFDTMGIIPDSILSDVPPSPEEAKRRWKVITWIPENMLHVPWRALFTTMVCTALVLLALGCWYLADNRVRQAEVEARLRENEERTIAISQSSQDAIVMVDHTGTISHWNPSAERLFGYRHEEAIGQDLHNLLVPVNLRAKAKAGMKRFATSGRGDVIDNVIEVDALRKDGTLVPVELAISSFQFKEEWYAVGSMRDATQRKRSELELRRSEETSRALINAPTESAMLIEPSGAILAINEIGARRFGGSVDDMIGKNAYELISPGQPEQRKSTIMEVRKTGDPVTFEEIRHDRRMLVNVYPVKNPDDTVDSLALFARDVTEQRLAETALKHSEQRFRDVSEAVGEFIWETDADGAFKFITEDVSLVLGYSSSDLIGTKPQQLLPRDDVDHYNEWRKGIYQRREPFSNLEMRNVTREGKVIWMQLNGVPYFDEMGTFQGFRGAAMNITDRKEAADAIKASERKLRALAESAYDAIIMIDTNGRVSFWNDAAEHLFGYTEEEALNHNVHDLIAPPQDRAKAEMGMYQFAMTGEGPAVGESVETLGQHKSGATFPVERSISSFRLGEEWYAVATIRDITERKATEAKLRELATTDSLTGLFNRRRFMELSEREFARSIRYDRPLAMFMLDIDHFKQVNDNHGHDVGDQVLRSLSEISIMALRNADILGRLGGEEFGVLLPETDPESANEVAERLRLSIERASIDTNAGELKITVSIGVAIMTSETQTIEHLLKRADIALYDAKQSGRNRVVVG